MHKLLAKHLDPLERAIMRDFVGIKWQNKYSSWLLLFLILLNRFQKYIDGCPWKPSLEDQPSNFFIFLNAHLQSAWCSFHLTFSKSQLTKCKIVYELYSPNCILSFSKILFFNFAFKTRPNVSIISDSQIDCLSSSKISIHLNSLKKWNRIKNDYFHDFK
jgi:hypothetical protein